MLLDSGVIKLLAKMILNQLYFIILPIVIVPLLTVTHSYWRHDHYSPLPHDLTVTILVAVTHHYYFWHNSLLLILWPLLSHSSCDHFSLSLTLWPLLTVTHLVAITHCNLPGGHYSLSLTWWPSTVATHRTDAKLPRKWCGALNLSPTRDVIRPGGPITSGYTTMTTWGLPGGTGTTWCKRDVGWMRDTLCKWNIIKHASIVLFVPKLNP